MQLLVVAACTTKSVWNERVRLHMVTVTLQLLIQPRDWAGGGGQSAESTPRECVADNSLGVDSAWWGPEI